MGQVGDTGFQCGQFCIGQGVWCKVKEIEKPLQLNCPELLVTLQNRDLCQNSTFWKHKKCGAFGYRCTGNYPGQCYMVHSCKYQPENDCLDKSNIRATADEIHLCNKADFQLCNDNYTYILRDNLCDGYFQCPDGSDEDPNICQICPRSFGHPSLKRSSATFACRHRYTNLTICATPCDNQVSISSTFYKQLLLI